MSLCIIDGYNFVFRAFHSLPSLSTSYKLPIGAVYGFVNMIVKILEQEKSPRILIALDSKERCFRYEIYNQYKSNRNEPDEDLKIQFPLIREAIEALQIKGVEIPGYEADDIIASYTKKALNEGISIKIISSDKDLVQLMQKNVELYDPIKKVYIDENFIINKYKITPCKMIDFLSLTGDQSDNIPGVRGVGPVTAAKLLNEFNNLENIYLNIDKIKNLRTKSLLQESKNNAFISKSLVTLKTDLDLPYKIEELSIEQFQQNKFTNFLEKYEFYSLLDKFDKKSISLNIEKKSLKDLLLMIDEIREYGFFYFYYTSNRFTCFFGKKYIIEIDQPIRLKELEQLFYDTSIKKISIDCKPFIKNHPNTFEDISVLFYSLYTSSSKLDDIKNFYNIKYQHNDAYCIYLLYTFLLKDIVNRKNFSLYYYFERPLLPLLLKMERKGVKVEENILISLEHEFCNKLKILEKEIYELAGIQFNIGSPKQIGEVLFKKMDLSIGKKSAKSGYYITDAETLEKLSASGVKIAKNILLWRHYTKLINTYLKPLTESISKIDGRVHTTFSMTTTSTGRLSSHTPNLQNIPIKTRDSSRIRSAFIAEPNKKILSADYSQIELRVLAHVANIETLKKAFLEKKDIHKITAQQIFNIINVTEEDRRKAKAINFGIIYGLSPYGLANNIGITKEKAKKYIESYFHSYPGIKEYMDTTIKFARRNGYVETLNGRRCYIKNINSKNYILKTIAERSAINAPIQGTASEIIKKAMINMSNNLQNNLILQIHDELLFEIDDGKIDYFKDLISKTMKNVCNLSIPLDVKISVGDSWYSAKL